MLRESPIDIQILQREGDSAAANICTRTFMKHPKKRKARLFVIKPHAFSYLGGDSGENLPSDYPVYTCVPPARFLRRILFSVIFFLRRFYRRTTFSLSLRIILYNVQLPRENMQTSRLGLFFFNYLYYTNEWNFYRIIVGVHKYLNSL